MIREELLKTWTNLKPKFNQLVQWKQAFPNETAQQVKVRINTLQSSYNTANEQLNMLRNQNAVLQANYNQISSQLTTTRTELEKERSWWNKWMNDSGRGVGFISIDTYDRICDHCNKIGDVVNWPDGTRSTFKQFSGNNSTFKQDLRTKVYQYYRDR